MEENNGKKGFTLGLALLDAVPVIAFGINMALLAKPLQSRLFLAGAILSLFAGSCMVVYKLLLVAAKKEAQTPCSCFMNCMKKAEQKILKENRL